MSDEEILTLLEAREHRRYAGVAEQTANLMMGDFRIVTDEMLESIEQQQSQDDVPGGIRDLLDRFDELWTRVDDLQLQLDNLPEAVDPADPLSMEHTLAAVVNARQMGLVSVSMRVGDLTNADIDAIERVLNSTPDMLSYVQNRRELAAWQALQSVVFESGSDIGEAIRQVVAAHEAGDRPRAMSVRAIAARFKDEARGKLT
jgi:hypothetical protein